MSTQPALPFVPGLSGARIPGRVGGDLAIGGLSAGGLLLFVIGVLVVGSGFSALRPEVMGLALHPYLVVVALAFPVVAMVGLGEFPTRVLVALFVFCGTYFLSLANGASIQFSEVFKVTASVMALITCALLVRKRGDFVAGALGLSIAVVLLAIKGLQDETLGGIDVMEGANRNSYSMYALPSLLLTGYIALNILTVPKLVKTIMIGGALPIIVVIFLSGNRSGYLGCVLIGLMLLWERRGKGMLLVAAVVAAVMLWIVQFASTQVINERWRQTVEGNRSDDMRVAIAFACLQIGLENPIVGVSPQMLSYEIGRHLPTELSLNAIDSHNVHAHIFGGSGVLCYLAMCGVGWAMWTWKPRNGVRVGGREDPLREPLRLLRMMVVLWAVRGIFSREVLYNPSFFIAFGLCIGLCMITDKARSQRMRLAAARPM